MMPSLGAATDLISDESEMAACQKSREKLTRNGVTKKTAVNGEMPPKTEHIARDENVKE